MNRSSIITFFILLNVSFFIGNSSCNTQELSAEKVNIVDSLYQRGTIYEDKLYPDSAFYCYVQAVHLLEGSGEYERLALLYNQIGEILSIHGYYANSIANHRKAILVAEHLEDKSLLSKAYRRIGKVYGCTAQFDSTLHYYLIAKGMCPFVSYKEQADIYNNMAAIYLRLKQYDSALYYNSKSINSVISNDARCSDFQVRADIFEQLHLYDSAIYCYKQSVQSSNIYLKTNSSRCLARLFASMGKIDSSYYQSELIYWNDSLDRILKKSEIGDYNYTFQLEQVKKEKKYEELYTSLFILFVIIMFFLIIYMRKIKKLYRQKKMISREFQAGKRLQEKLEYEQKTLLSREKFLNQKEEEAVLAKTELMQLQERIVNKEFFLAEKEIFSVRQMEKERKILEQEKAELISLRNSYEKIYKELQLQKESLETEYIQMKQNIEEFSIKICSNGTNAVQKITKLKEFILAMKKLSQAAVNKNCSFSKVEKERLLTLIKNYFEGYIYDLQHFCGLNEEESLFCCFTLIGFTSKQYQELFSVSESEPRIKKFRILKKMRRHIWGEKLISLTFFE